MRKRVEEFIREHKMLEPGSRVIVGVSGGADSVCLLQVLFELRESLGVQLRAVHVHHGLRGEEADRDAAFVEELCGRLGLECTVVHRDVRGYAAQQGISEEEAGRELRYEIFKEMADGWDEECGSGIMEAGWQIDRTGGNDRPCRIAVAHHQEDQAETILHNLFRGSGLKGLGGMAPVRGQVIRPLLCVSRSEIEAYLRERGIGYCTDSTNGTLDYTRNRLRNHLIPEICQEINAGAVEHIVAAGQRMAQADAYLEQQAMAVWENYGTDNDGMLRGGRCGIQAEVLESQPDILKGYVIRHMVKLRTGSMKDITAAHIEQIVGLVKLGTGKQISLPYHLTAWMEYGVLWIGDKDFRNCVDNSKQPAELSMTHFPYEKHQEIPQNRYTKWFDYDKIKGALSVRTRQTGDYITLTDGKHKTVKSYMIDEKIPKEQRDKVLLLAEGSHILWIVGYRISEYYKVTESTKNILQVQADGGEEHGR